MQETITVFSENCRQPVMDTGVSLRLEKEEKEEKVDDEEDGKEEEKEEKG